MDKEVTFSDLIREAFIDPLRSVLIIDDEYPTWERIFQSKNEGEGENGGGVAESSVINREFNRAISSEISDLIKKFRSLNPGLVIDIHDGVANDPEEKNGGETPAQLADHLHQSDLLVLDYNLEGNGTGLGGMKAREILRSILTAPHFNLVVIHTIEDLEDVFSECLLALMKAVSVTEGNTVYESDGVKELYYDLLELEVEGNFNYEDLNAYFSVLDYFEFRKYRTEDKAVRAFMSGTGRLARLKGWGEQVGLEGGRLKHFLFWAIREFERGRINDFSTECALDSLSWDEGEVKWLRTSGGFVSFINKGNTRNLIDNLQRAIQNWKPTPSRLLYTKFRNIINKVGVESEDTSLKKEHAFAYFYRSILCPSHADVPASQAGLLREYKLKDHISRLSEEIAFQVENEIVKFGNKIIEADNNGNQRFVSHYNVNLESDDDKRKAVEQYNSYVSTFSKRAINRDGVMIEQLDSGHVFILEDEWWVCATPACDLQPGQTSIAVKGHSDDLRPFTALRLEKVDASKLSKLHVNSGSFCFIDHEGEVTVLGPRNLREESEPATQKVRWRIFVAKDGGKIKDRKLKLLQLELGGEDLIKKFEAEVVSKLRYEYALNYIQLIGNSVSRIGLGYAVF